MLTDIRRRFHPLTLKDTAVMTTALTCNMLLQLWLYDTGRSVPAHGIAPG